MTRIKKDLVDKIIDDHRTNLTYHSYFMLLEICGLNARFKKPGGKTLGINLYDNLVRSG